MIIKLVKYKSGYLGISNEKINVLSNDYVWSEKLQEPIKIVSNPITERGHEAIKIICTTSDLKLEGVPLIDLKNEELLLAEEIYREFPNNSKGNLEQTYNRDVHCFKKRKAFIKGYNLAKEKYKYTEEDLRKAIELAREADSIDGMVDLDIILNFPNADNFDLKIKYLEEEIIGQISNKKVVSIEVESEIIHLLSNPSQENIRFKTQIINGKEFVMIKNIKNYEK